MLPHQDVLAAARALARDRPDEPVVAMADSRGRIRQALTRAEVWRRAEAFAEQLLASGDLDPGDRAVLVFPPGLDFVVALLGGLAARIVPVPAYPPDPFHLDRDLAAFQRLLDDAGTRVVLSNGRYRRARRLQSARDLLRSDGAAWPDDLVWHHLGGRGGGRGAERLAGLAAPGADDIALLQYTSGSTSAPRGVALTHGNLAHQLRFNREQLGMGTDAHAVMWLPPYHDFGLISGILSALAGNCRLSMLAPQDFIREPASWMALLHHAGATHTAAPDFGYRHVVRKTTPAQRAGWDLSRLQVAMSAAEPVRPDTMDRFLAAFAASGLRPEALCPAYGLAEHAVGVTVGGRGRLQLDRTALETAGRIEATPDPEGTRLLGCGRPVEDVQVRIVDPETRRPLAGDRVGEIWVDSPSKAVAYWGRPDDTRERLQARLAGSESPGNWLRTGDLGFLHDGELFVCGRLKDLIIVAGRNLAPQDLEDCVRGVDPLVRPGGVAAFSIPTASGEGVGLLIEVRDPQAGPTALRDLAGQARAAVLRHHPLPSLAIVLGAPGSVSKTTSGKVQRGRCGQRYRDGSLLAEALLHDLQERSDVAPAVGTEPELSEVLTLAEHTLGLAAGQLSPDRAFAVQGMGSITAVEFAARLSEALGRDVPVALLFDHPTPRGLTAALAGRADTRVGVGTGPVAPIAVIGLSCRFPGGATDPEAFWQLLESGRDAVGEVPAWRWSTDRWYDPDPAAPGRTVSRWGGFVDGLRDFDAAHFGVSPSEAASVDPQERLLLETSWEALERAGLDPRALAGSPTGVFVGLTGGEYQAQLLQDPADLRGWSLMNATPSGVVGRLSYALGLEGPNLALDTACSSSLVALHQACQALRAGECTLALAGGVNALLDPRGFVALSKAGALSPTGRCRPFAEGADGYVRAEGCGVLVLKPLDRALADGDPIQAVIRGSAVNQDGRSNGFTAPSGLAQQALIGSALAASDLDPAELDYVECHGTGTPLGDPIELRALGAVMAERSAPLLVGSVKSQIGHAEAAAGVAGVIKTVLALQAGRLPGSLHAGELSSRIPWTELPVEVVRETRAWLASGRPRRAGVSSFGLSGTNAHVVLEQAPPSATPPAVRPTTVFQRTRAWIPRRPAVAAPGSVGPFQTPVRVAGVGWVQDALLGEDQDWLNQHRVAGEALLPFTWFLTWLAALGRLWAGQEAVTVRDLQLERSCPWRPPLHLQAQVDPAGQARILLREGDDWLGLVTARFSAGLPPEASVGAGQGTAIDPAALYETLADRGLAYGPPFRRVEGGVLPGPGVAAVTLAPLAPLAGLGVHPALLDAGLHPAALVLGEQVAAALPTGAEAYGEWRPGGPVGAGHLRRQAHVPAGEAALDLTLVGGCGPVAVLQGLRLAPLHRQRTRVLALHWEPVPVPQEAALPGAVQLVGAGPRADSLASHLARAGVVVQRTQAPGPEGADTVWLPGPGDTASLLAAAQRLVRSLASGSRGPRLIAVTGGALASVAPDPAAAALWAALRSVGQELPGTWRLRDVSGPWGSVSPAQLLGDDPELAFRSDRAWRPTHRPAGPLPPPPGPGRRQRVRHAGDGRLAGVGLEEGPLGVPGPGQVRIQVRAASLNFRDVLATLGQVPGAPQRGLGGECAGVIDAVGEGVQGLAPGDRVVGLGPGCLASSVVLDAREVRPAPSGLRWTELATLPLAGVTAWHALVALGGLRAGQRVLIHAAAGGVGLAAVQLAQALGAEVLATAHPDKWPVLRARGIQHLASSRDTAFAETFTRAFGERPVDLVLDALHGAQVDAGLRLVRPGGRFIELGRRDVRDPAEVLAHHGVHYTAFDLALASPEARGALLARVLAEVDAGRFAPLPHRTFPLGAAPEALRWLAEARHVGRVVLAAPAPGGTALITGGRGALGQRVARWLAERRGVTRLVLVGRTAPGEAPAWQAAVEEAGCAVEHRIADVTDPDAVAALVASVQEELRWVVHAAGVLEDGLAVRQSAVARARVLAPKLDAVRLLDAATADLDLAGFVAFGSAAAWFGSPGQSAYAAGNAAMAAVVAGRRARGQLAWTVAWGPWEGGGMAGGRKVQRQLRRLGIGTLQPQDGLARLDELLWSAAEDLAVVARTARAPAARPARFHRPDQPLAAQIRAIVAGVLGLDPDALDDRLPLEELGVDSLVGIELRNALEVLDTRRPDPALSLSETTLSELVEALAPRA